ncbi:copper chaperone PCu(A)C [Mycolicibacterium novocastrense]|uniref:Copper chaperone PCu(A)C n=2 Tax=Mycolicibacterium novocastrense TaxID=59813 RepID=A0AAW5SNP6_MYCNV|nr:copper chaperone PCu(A)C [Mycolicibacterium novocastrense]MCV7024673.1 copper chaperone PCu(A)C [Mycolicibacterium novocastrense]
MSDRIFHGLLLLIAATVVAGCTTHGQHDEGPMASEVSLADQWASSAQTGMAAVFGTLTNAGHHDARIVSGRSDAAGRVEVHEVSADAGARTMRPKDGGLVIPAGGSRALVPGGDHLMLMDLKQPLLPGSEVTLTVEFEDGSTLPVTAQVRDFAGANEDYQPSAGGPAPHHDHG